MKDQPFSVIVGNSVAKTERTKDNRGSTTGLVLAVIRSAGDRRRVTYAAVSYSVSQSDGVSEVRV